MTPTGGGQPDDNAPAPPAHGASIVVPFRPGDPWRDEVWAWLSEAWARLLPEVEVCAADGGGMPFSRSASCNAAADLATGDVLVVTDGDTWIEPESLRRAVARVRAGEPWLPKALKTFVGEDDTRRLAAGPLGPTFEIDRRSASDAFTIPAPTVLSRGAFDRVGGFDERFRGWGCEDNAFILALQALVAPRPKRAEGLAYHFWHPNRMLGGEQVWDGQDEALPGQEHLRRYHGAYTASYRDRGATMEMLVRNNRHEDHPRVDRLRRIWKTNGWRGRDTRSGPGSARVSTERTARELEGALLGVESVLDVGCGECLWQPKLRGYVGIDAVPEAIAVARKRHPDWDLRVLDAVDEPLPHCEAVLARDVLVHLELDEGAALLQKIRATGARLLLATTFTDGQNVGPGKDGWYRVDMTADPFGLGPADRLIDDGQHPGYVVPEKKLGVWRLA